MQKTRFFILKTQIPCHEWLAAVKAGHDKALPNFRTIAGQLSTSPIAAVRSAHQQLLLPNQQILLTNTEWN